MNPHDDERIDAALEALARPDPPTDHVARVLARSGPHAATRSGRAGSPLRLRSGQASRPTPLVWSLATTAAVLVALGATWLLRVGPVTLPSPEATSVLSWGAPREIDRPVLPPQAYWGMDAFDEWKSLRPGSGGASSEVGRGVPPRRNPTAVRSSAGAGTAPQLAWVPVPSGLPLVELEPITSTPIEVAPLAPLEDITITDIALAPIVIAPVDEQEKP